MSVEITNINSVNPTGENTMSTQLSHYISIPAPTEMENHMQTLYSRDNSKTGFNFSQDTIIEPNVLQAERTNPLTDDNFIHLYKRDDSELQVTDPTSPEISLTTEETVEKSTDTAVTATLKQEITDQTHAQLEDIRQSLSEKIEQKNILSTDEITTEQKKESSVKSEWLTLQKKYAAKTEEDADREIIDLAQTDEIKNSYLKKLEERVALVDQQNTKENEITKKDELVIEEGLLLKNSQQIDDIKATIIAERDRKTDQARIALAVQIGERLLDESLRNGGDGVDAIEIANLMPARPGELVSFIRRQLHLSDISEAQYDEFKTKIAQGGRMYNLADIIRVVRAAADGAPAVQLSREITTEEVNLNDHERAISLGNENLLFTIS